MTKKKGGQKKHEDKSESHASAPKDSKPEGGAGEEFKFDFGGAFDPKFASVMKTGAASSMQFATADMLESKLKQIALAETSDFIGRLPPVVQERVKELQELQKKNNEITKQRDEEIQAIMLKYDVQQQPLRDKRKEIVVGNAEDKPKGIPDFWLTTLKNHPEVSDMIQPEDENCLSSLLNISARPLKEKRGFVLEFEFSENEFFTNTVLTKQYTLNDDMLEDVKGCDIDWKPKKDLTKKTITKKNKKNGKIMKKVEDTDSFFRFFATPNPEEMSDEMEMDFSDLVEADYDLGVLIRQMAENAVSWFDGSALKELLGDDDDEDDDDDEGDDDEDDDDDDNDDDEDDDEPAAPGPKPEDCKQQ